MANVTEPPPSPSVHEHSFYNSSSKYALYLPHPLPSINMYILLHTVGRKGRGRYREIDGVQKGGMNIEHGYGRKGMGDHNHVHTFYPPSIALYLRPPLPSIISFMYLPSTNRLSPPSPSVHNHVHTFYSPSITMYIPSTHRLSPCISPSS